jgi:glycosyltransferase involved in cell wall biosynthesis
MFLAATGDLELDVDVIHRVSHPECLRRKSVAGLFFDQSSSSPAEVDGIDGAVGWYGNSTVEAAAFGIPAIAHLSTVALRNAARAGLDVSRLPIINTPCGADALRGTIERYYAMSRGERRELSLETRAWVERVHSYEAVAAKLAALYERIVAPAPTGSRRPSSSS